MTFLSWIYFYFAGINPLTMSILEKITPILKVVQGAQSITEIERRYSAQEKIGVFMCRRGEMEVELSGRV